MLRAIARFLSRLDLTLPGAMLSGGWGSATGRSRGRYGSAPPGYTVTGVYSGGRRASRFKDDGLKGPKQSSRMGRANEALSNLRMGNTRIEDFRPINVTGVSRSFGRNENFSIRSLPMPTPLPGMTGVGGRRRLYGVDERRGGSLIWST